MTLLHASSQVCGLASLVATRQLDKAFTTMCMQPYGCKAQVRQIISAAAHLLTRCLSLHRPERRERNCAGMPRKKPVGLGCITDWTAYLQSMRKKCRQLCSAALKPQIARFCSSGSSRHLRRIRGRYSLPADAGRQRSLRACRRLRLRSLASSQPRRPPAAQAHDCHIIMHRLAQAP